MDILFGLSIVSAIVCAVLASKKDRNAAGWFFIGLLLGIFGIILVVFMSPVTGGEKYKKCPECAETILSEAKKCKHCGYVLPKEIKEKQRETTPTDARKEIEEHIKIKYENEEIFKISPTENKFVYHVETSKRMVEIEVGGFETKSKVI